MKFNIILAFIISIFISIFGIYNYSLLINSLGILLLIVSFWKPFYGLFVFLLVLPIFGNRPGTEQAILLDYFSSVFIIGSFYKVLKIKSENGFIKLINLFVFASFLSLLGLPVLELYRNTENFFSFYDYNSFVFNIGKFLQQNELSLYYPIRSAIYTLFATYFGYVAYYSRSQLKVLTVLFFASLHTLIFGLLNYYKFIKLDWLRKLDPVVNPTGEFRLQSYFGHSGWLAEFLTITAPLILVIFLSKIKFIYKLIFTLFLMILTEFTLILTYQRGGWLSYPITALVIWISIYYFYSKNKNKEISLFNVIKKSSFKIILSIPITIIISLLIIKSLSNENQQIVNMYKDRFVQISKASDRLDFVKTAIRFSLLHPFAGGAPESFGYQYEREVNNPNGRLYNYVSLPLHGTAHNFYLQILSGRGILGFSLLLFLVAGIFYSSIKTIKNSDDNNIILILSTTCVLISFIIYGNVQEFFYIQILQIIFFVIIANYACQHDIKLSKIIYYFIFLLSILHLIWEFVIPGNNSKYISSSFGCYQNTNSSLWCSKNSNISFKVVDNKIKFQIKGISDKQVITATIQGKEELLKVDKTFKLFEFPVLDTSTTEVKFHTNHYFIPAMIDKNNKDNRILSFELRE